MANPNAKARVQRKYEAQYRDPIQVKAGESVEVGRADNDDPGWLWCRAVDCREGWVPVELLSGQGARAVMREDYSAKELAVFPGDDVEVEKACHGWLLVRNAQGERGWIPLSHTRDLRA
jgi:SH3-like domain-containing protein